MSALVAIITATITTIIIITITTGGKTDRLSRRVVDGDFRKELYRACLFVKASAFGGTGSMLFHCRSWLPKSVQDVSN
jgi:hypothetical protein